jgi:DNA invertase Pin-like site-specific DNA recombinase
MKIGYTRVSSTHQDLLIQIRTLQEKGCERIYSEKISGKSKDRPELQRMLNDVREGDIVIVTKLDRLGRNLQHLHEIVNLLHDKKVHFKVLSNPDMDTSSVFGKMIFSILGTISEFERGLINERCQTGREEFIRRGGKLGRKSKFSDEVKQQIQFLHKVKNLSWNQLSEQFQCSRQTIYRILSAG